MVLGDLGSRISRALYAMSNATFIDEAVLDACLKEICTALLQADINVKLVAALRKNVKGKVNVEELAAGLNKRKIIEKAVFEELCGMLSSGGGEAKKGVELKKGKTTIVMFVGLQVRARTRASDQRRRLAPAARVTVLPHRHTCLT